MKKTVLLMLPWVILFAVAGPAEPKGENPLQLKSPAFENNGFIPVKFSCEGKDINPAFVIEGVPPGTESLALIADDPDAPGGMWVHWVVCNIAPIGRIEENSVPGEQGTNDFGKKSYAGPCPFSGIHRYFFKLYALDVMLNLSEGFRKPELEKAMDAHILAKAELTGLYKRENNGE
ncbi:MAG: YbhB/YbcL family Raf kinase inhibitor-like protein [Candidatus Omnitrophota bacterium]